MKKKINIIIICILTFLILLCGYLIVDKYFVSKTHTILCTYENKNDVYKTKLIRKIKYDETGKIISNQNMIENTYFDKETYKQVKDELYTKKTKKQFNDKKLTYTYDAEEDVSNEYNNWYVSYTDDLKELGYTCK